MLEFTEITSFYSAEDSQENKTSQRLAEIFAKDTPDKELLHTKTMKTQQ